MPKKSHVLQLRNLLGRCNPTTAEVLLEAVNACRRAGHREVVVEHVLAASLRAPLSDVVSIVRSVLNDPESWGATLSRHLSGLEVAGVVRPPFSAEVVGVLETAWSRASVDMGRPYVRSGDFLWAVLARDDDRPSAPIRDLLDVLDADKLAEEFDGLTAGAREETSSAGGDDEAVPSAPASAARGGAPSGMAKAPSAVGGGGYLDAYCTNFTLLAEEGKLDPIFGRDAEIRETIDILARRRKNNPILVGEPGVGKTAIVEGLALRIIQGDVPANFIDFQVIGLDMGLLQAGAGAKGEFEKRLKGVIQEVKDSPVPIIFFIDEAHTLIGAGGPAGGGDAANLLKPALARGELRSIAATTWSEYKQYFETDPALTRRFQLVHIKEPDLEDAAVMLRGLRSKYEEAHGVRILDGAVTAAVECAKRYISGRYLPDSAIDLIDTAGAKVKNVLESKPAPIDQLERELGDLEIERLSVQREAEEGRRAAPARVDEVESRKALIVEELDGLRKRWAVEREQVEAIHGIAQELEEARDRLALSRGESDWEVAANVETERTELAKSMGEELDKLKTLQGDDALLHAEVDAETVRSVVAEWTGVPVNSMDSGGASLAAGLDLKLAERIKGQPGAIETVSMALKAHQAGVSDPSRPIGVFLMLGPSGVGKTELALVVADLVFGGDGFVTKINMSEYGSGFSESRLIGAPPGYVGYGKGGVLTEAVRKKPYSVVLLDEVDRADQQVWNLFYSPFERGEMNDGEGRTINFRNTCIFLTSNLGSETILNWQDARESVHAAIAEEEAAEKPDADAIAQARERLEEGDLSFQGLSEALKEEAASAFTYPLLARMTLVPFITLGEDVLAEIAVLKLDRLAGTLADQRDMTVTWSEEVPVWIAGQCGAAGMGARLVDQVIQVSIMPDITDGVLERLAAGEEPRAVRLEIPDDEDGGIRVEVT